MPCSQPSTAPTSATPALLSPIQARECQPGHYTGNAIVIQPALYSFSFPQAFIYSMPCILHRQIFLLREGFLVKAAPACLEIFYSTCFSIILKCFFESQLRTNLIQGFFCLHKGRLQKHARKGRMKINSHELIQVLTVALTDTQHLAAMDFTPLY